MKDKKYVAIRKKDRVNIFGYLRNILTGTMSWGKLGTITYHEDTDSFCYTPAWCVLNIGEDTISIINNEIEELNRKRTMR